MLVWPSCCDTEVFVEAIITDSALSEATRIISTHLAHNLTGQFQHVQRFCLEPDPLQLTLGLLTAV